MRPVTGAWTVCFRKILRRRGRHLLRSCHGGAPDPDRQEFCVVERREQQPCGRPDDGWATMAATGRRG
jgi:hypothetical protein